MLLDDSCPKNGEIVNSVKIKVPAVIPATDNRFNGSSNLPVEDMIVG